MPLTYEDQGATPSKWRPLLLQKSPDPAFCFKTGECKSDVCLVLCARIQAVLLGFFRIVACLALPLAVALSRASSVEEQLILVAFGVTVVLVLCLAFTVSIAILSRILFRFSTPTASALAADPIPHAPQPQELTKAESIFYIEWGTEQGQTETIQREYREQLLVAELVADVACCLDGRVKKSGYSVTWWMENMSLGELLNLGSSGKTLKDAGIKSGSTVRVFFRQSPVAA